MKNSVSRNSKTDRKVSRRSIPYQIHRYRENFALSWFGSILLHVIFFAVLFILPVPYNNTPPSITLEMWEPTEVELAPMIQQPAPEKEEMLYAGQLSYVRSRYRDLQYHPKAKTSAEEPAVKPVSSPGQPKPAAQRPVTTPAIRPNAASGPLIAAQTDTVSPPQEVETEAVESESYTPEEYEDLHSSTDDYVQSDEEILGAELRGILEGDGNSQWLGDTLMNLHTAQRTLVTPPDLYFLTEEGFTSNIKVVRIGLTISPDGTVSHVSVVFPGTGNPELDRRLKLAFARVVFNDVREYGREVETGTIVLNFKG